MTKVILIVFLSTLEGTLKFTMEFENMNDCKIVEDSFHVEKYKIRWPKNIYKDGGGNPLAYFPCKEIES